MADEHYIAGDWWVIDDVTGLKIRASKSVKQWDGNRVDRSYAEPRHPQDYVRARADRQAVEFARPRPPDVFIGPLTVTVSARSEAGDDLISLSSTQGLEEGDRVWFPLASGDTFRTTILYIGNNKGALVQENGGGILLGTGGALLWTDENTVATVIRIADILPDAVTTGAIVVNNSQITEPVLP